MCHEWSQQRWDSLDTDVLLFFSFFRWQLKEAWVSVHLSQFFPASPVIIRIKILAVSHLFCLFCCLILLVICCPLVIIHTAVTDKTNRKKKRNHRRGRETRPKLNTKTAGHAAIQRPWKVGLYKALQKPWETLSKYIKDTVCSSSLLLFLLPSSSALSLDYSPLICLLRIFSSSSTRLLSVSSFTLLFRLFWPLLFQWLNPVFLGGGLLKTNSVDARGKKHHQTLVNRWSPRGKNILYSREKKFFLYTYNAPLCQNKFGSCVAPK